MNLRTITINHAADPEIRFFTKSISKPRRRVFNDDQLDIVTISVINETKHRIPLLADIVLLKFVTEKYSH